MPIKNCTCTNIYQDRMYGRGRRVHTKSKGGDVLRCTVCSSEKRAPNKGK